MHYENWEEPDLTPGEIAQMDAHANEQNNQSAALRNASLVEAAWSLIAPVNGDAEWTRDVEAWRECYVGDRDSPWPDPEPEPEPVTVPVEVGLLRGALTDVEWAASHRDEPKVRADDLAALYRLLNNPTKENPQ